jgi:hypothetical protein
MEFETVLLGTEFVILHLFIEYSWVKLRIRFFSTSSTSIHEILAYRTVAHERFKLLIIAFVFTTDMKFIAKITLPPTSIKTIQLDSQVSMELMRLSLMIYLS